MPLCRYFLDIQCWPLFSEHFTLDETCTYNIPHFTRECRLYIHTIIAICVFVWRRRSFHRKNEFLRMHATRNTPLTVLIHTKNFGPFLFLCVALHIVRLHLLRLPFKWKSHAWQWPGKCFQHADIPNFGFWRRFDKTHWFYDSNHQTHVFFFYADNGRLWSLLRRTG